MRVGWRFFISLWLPLGLACATGTGSNERPEGVSGAGVGQDDDPLKVGNVPRDAGGGTVPPLAGVCGNGSRTPDEACDDANDVGGDGCSADCKAIEPGFSCYPAGEPCRPIARCGDGLVAVTEACDDANLDPGDGCSERCKVEQGSKCDGEPSVCSPTLCGDGVPEGVEGCDDGNDIPFDGCSTRCQTEPACGQGGACDSTCGDGLVLNEACDDGNQKDGDGCSAACEIEPGFSCTTADSCELQDGQCILRVSAIFRDFSASHPDFGVGCGMLVRGVVEQQLDAQGKPLLADGSQVCIQSPASFAQWYTDNAENTTTVGGLTLYENGSGGYVNRFGPAGEQFEGPVLYSNIVWGGNGGTGCGMCTPSPMGQCFDPCLPWGDTQACCADSSQTLYDGNPLFFPLDDAAALPGDTPQPAKIPEQYGYDGWPFEETVFPGAPVHNFHFTTEVVYWFKYDDTTSAVLEFNGDDDVWVFVNRQLAVDLGGPHVPEAGSVTIDGTSAARFGLTPNNVYEVRVFHAERKIAGSSFKLTLSGFNTSPSDCTPICGDGVVTLGEECDDGVNAGGYEQCAPGCVLGPSCGDGVLQEEEEDCDDGNRRDGDDCGSSCRNLMVD